MKETWFNVVSDVDDSTPQWMTEAIKDKEYVVIPKDEYYITCEILEKLLQQQRDKIKNLETLSIMNSNIFGNQMSKKEKIIEDLEYKIKQYKQNNKKALNFIKKANNNIEKVEKQYDELKHRCDIISEVVSCLYINKGNTNDE